ncbi:MAG: hypothetical protein J6I31_08395 [Prevotella sp.]|nr:hypothetical protein [Prevotella sp.]
MMKNLRKAILVLMGWVMLSNVASAQEYVYTNDLTKANDATVVGAGTFVEDATFGTVFQNVGTALRTNYLLLPEDVLAHSVDSKALTIGFWVSAEGFTPDQYTYAPLFSAYGLSPADNAAAGKTGNDENFPMFIVQSRGTLQVNNGGWCDFGGNLNVAGKNTIYNSNSFEATNADFINGGNWLEDQGWHYFTLVLTETNVKMYLDGEVKNEWNVDGVTEGQVLSGFFTYGGNYKYICLGGNQAWNWSDNDAPFKFAQLRIQNMAMTQADIKAIVDSKPQPAAEDFTYTNNFTASEQTDLTIVGSGSFVDDDTFGTIFKNVASSAPRSNYLLLPDGLLSHSAISKALSVGFWVSAEDAGESAAYAWAPLFMAYGAAPEGTNTWPMFGCQYRGVIQVNCAGYCDYVDAQNVAGVNTLYNKIVDAGTVTNDNDWLADKDWHYYTVVLENNNAKVYFDGVVKNEWNLSGEGDGNVQQGLFTNGSELKYICLGGNQAWAWGDNDPGFKFAQFLLKNKAMTPEEIKAIVDAKPVTDGISAAIIAKDDVNAPMFDLAGRRVVAGFKGIVIKNGKKMVVR